MTEQPRKCTDQELAELAQKIALATLQFCADQKISAGDTASMMALACMEVHCQAHGIGGLEYMRTAIDVGELQLMGQLK